MPITQSPLRYPGGKNILKNDISKLIEVNNLLGCTYVEPFAGGSALALSLLFDGIVNRIVINDYDHSVYAFWHSVLNEPEGLCDLISNTEITMHEWESQRRIQDRKEDIHNLLELGFSTLFLNRTNRSGIIKAGVMGGKNQEGPYKMNCRFNKDDLIKKIRRIYSFRDSIQLFNMDAIVFLDEFVENLNDNTFIFFDPPYYEKGQSLYVNFYNHLDHQRLADKINEIQDKRWIVTYDNVEEINMMYRRYRNIKYSLSYTAQVKYEGKEVMFFSDNIIPLEAI